MGGSIAGHLFVLGSTAAESGAPAEETSEDSTGPEEDAAP
jgi:hypothetical protein